MAHPDISRRKQLAARLKSAIATAAIVGTLGGWLAFGTQQTSTPVASTTTSAAAPVVAQSAASNNTTRAMGCQMLAVIDRDDAVAATRLAVVDCVLPANV